MSFYWVNKVAYAANVQAYLKHNYYYFTFLIPEKLEFYLSWLKLGESGLNSLKKSLNCEREFLKRLVGKFSLIVG
jgi:hypothetical protein